MPRARARAACASSRACWSTGFELDGRRVNARAHRPGRRSPATSSSTPPASGRATSARWRACSVPAGVVEHQYLITEKSNAIPPGLPTLRDPDNIFYLKPEPGALADRRLGKRHAGLRRERRALLVRPRALAAEPGAAGAVRAARRRAPADPERARHPHRDQRPDPDLAPTASRSWVSRRNSTISTSPAASPRASPRRAAPARRWPNWIVEGEPGHGPLGLRRAPLRHAIT